MDKKHRRTPPARPKNTGKLGQRKDPTMKESDAYVTVDLHLKKYSRSKQSRVKIFTFYTRHYKDSKLESIRWNVAGFNL